MNAKRRSIAARCLAAAALAAMAGGAFAAEPDAAAPRLETLPGLLHLPSVLALPADANAEPMDLLGAQDAALGWSTDVEAARHRVDAFEDARDAARGALLPHAELSAARGRGHLDNGSSAATLMRRDVTVSLRQAVVDESARFEMRHQSVLVQSAEQQLRSAVSQARLESGSAYLAALQSRVTVALGDDYEAMLAELLRFVSERAAAGGASPADRERVRARVANAKSALADSRSAQTAALRNLRRLTGHTPAQLSFATPADLPEAGSLEQTLAVAEENNPELLASRREIEAAGEDYRGQRARFLPRLDLEVSRESAENLAGSLSRTRDERVMLRLTVPLLSGGTDYAQMKAAGARREQLRASAVNVQRKLELEIETAYANLAATDARFDSVREEIAANMP